MLCLCSAIRDQGKWSFKKFHTIVGLIFITKLSWSLNISNILENSLKSLWGLVYSRNAIWRLSPCSDCSLGYLCNPCCIACWEWSEIQHGGMKRAWVVSDGNPLPSGASLECRHYSPAFEKVSKSQLADKHATLSFLNLPFTSPTNSCTKTWFFFVMSGNARKSTSRATSAFSWHHCW